MMHIQPSSRQQMVVVQVREDQFEKVRTSATVEAPGKCAKNTAIPY